MGLGLGTGEIVSGPFLIVKNGPSILWIALLSILLQTVTSISASKYTILTGEPFQIGINRLWLSNKAWTVIWILLGGVSVMFPYYMALLGMTFVAIIIQGVPGLAQQSLWVVFSLISIGITILPLFLGKKVMKTLGLMFFLLHFLIIIPLLIILTIIFVPSNVIWEVFSGYFRFGYLPENADWLAMGAVAGFAGLAASAGMSISNYYRDSGWGMSEKLGYIPGMVGGKKVKFEVKGYMPKVNAENKKRAKKWYRYILLELIPIFFVRSLATMVFPCALYYYFVPQEAATEETFGFTAVLAQNMTVVLPFAFWIIIFMLFVIFWVDGTGVVDGVVRQFANILWNSFPKLSVRFKGDIRKLYYGLLCLFTSIWVLLILTGTPPVTMVLYAGSLANIGGVIFAIGLLAVNYKFLPKEYRFSMIEVIVTIVSILFFGFFLVNALLATVGIVF